MPDIIAPIKRRLYNGLICKIKTSHCVMNCKEFSEHTGIPVRTLEDGEMNMPILQPQ